MSTYIKNHFYCFQLNDKKFIFDTYNIILLEVNELQLYIFNHFDESDINIAKNFNTTVSEIEQSKTLFKKFFKTGLFKSNIKEPLVVQSEDVGYISITPEHRCNLQCDYCFANAGENYKYNMRKMNTKLLDKALEVFYYKIFEKVSKIHIDFVGGGEPFLNVDIIEYVIHKTNELDQKTGKISQLWICTNGTIMSKKILDIIDNPKVNIGVSLDGDSDQQGIHRGDKNRINHYDEIIQNINYIRKNAQNRNLKDIWCLSVITNKTKSLIDILEHHKQHGFSSVQMKLVRLPKDNSLAIHKEDVPYINKMYKDLQLYLINKIKHGELTELLLILNDNDYFGKIIKRLILQEKYIGRCRAGKSKFSLTANGDIYPCDSFVGIEEKKLFNIDNTNINICNSELFAVNVYNRPKCLKCWGKYICGGDCYHNSLLVNGNVNMPDECYCEIEQYLIKLALELVYILSSNMEKYKYIHHFLKVRSSLNN